MCGRGIFLGLESAGSAGVAVRSPLSTDHEPRLVTVDTSTEVPHLYGFLTTP